MKTILSRAAAATAPLTVLMLPKCPLCVMPLLTATGIALPAAPLLDFLSVAIVAGFTLLQLRVSSSRIAQGLAIAGAALLIAGRLLPLAAATWLGVGTLVLIALL